jgi:hypothetical protein
MLDQSDLSLFLVESQNPDVFERTTTSKSIAVGHCSLLSNARGKENRRIVMCTSGAHILNIIKKNRVTT